MAELDTKVHLGNSLFADLNDLMEVYSKGGGAEVAKLVESACQCASFYPI